MPCYRTARVQQLHGAWPTDGLCAVCLPRALLCACLAPSPSPMGFASLPRRSAVAPSPPCPPPPPGGALTRSVAGPGGLRACDLIRVPPPRLGLDLRGLLGDEQSADVVLEVDGEEIKVGQGEGGVAGTQPGGIGERPLCRG